MSFPLALGREAEVAPEQATAPSAIRRGDGSDPSSMDVAGTLTDPALPHADYLPRLERHARDTDPAARLQAVSRIGAVLREPYISLKRPIECLSAKATLSDLAARDPDPAVRAAASEELGKVAQGGAVIRR